MEKNEIKKLLYKQNPKAHFTHIRKGNAYYSSVVSEDNGQNLFIRFEVPIIDMGDADFLVEMEGKFLIRWIFESI